MKEMSEKEKIKYMKELNKQSLSSHGILAMVIALTIFVWVIYLFVLGIKTIMGVF